MPLQWKIGVEIELLAPQGSSRLHLANAYAQLLNGSIHPFFHPDAEPSKVPGQKLFYNLTPAFEVQDAEGRGLLRLLDDITLQDDLDRKARPQPGWFRILSDDSRLLRLCSRHANPAMNIEDSLRTVGEFFGSEPVLDASGIVRLADPFGASIAMAAPLPGERERPCEVVTCPLERQQTEFLEAIFRIARELKFEIPQEGAIHIHFDAKPLQTPAVFKRLTRLLSTWRLWFRRLMKTNPRCRRLGPWHPTLYTLFQEEGVEKLEWDHFREKLMEPENLKLLSKYCDFNIRNTLFPPKGKETLEVRILPVHLEAEPVLQAALLFESILTLATQVETPLDIPEDHALPSSFSHFLHTLPLQEDSRLYWLDVLEKESSLEVREVETD